MASDKLTQNKFLNDGEVQQLLKLCNKHKGKRDSIMLRFALFTGARQAEVLDVKKADFGRGCVTIRGIKGSNNRTAILSPEFFTEISKFMEAMKDGDSLFPITTRTFRHIWQQWSPNRNKSGHCLRHTFGVRLYNNCEDIHLVKTALGHCSIQNTMKYLEFVESQRQMVTAVQGMWEKGLDGAA